MYRLDGVDAEVKSYFGPVARMLLSQRDPQEALEVRGGSPFAEQPQLAEAPGSLALQTAFVRCASPATQHHVLRPLVTGRAGGAERHPGGARAALAADDGGGRPGGLSFSNTKLPLYMLKVVWAADHGGGRAGGCRSLKQQHVTSGSRKSCGLLTMEECVQVGGNFTINL